jgi:L-ascorbate metabolism protein UlaG (beta-lactamase superfamily)
MLSEEINVYYIGAATALLEIGGVRFLTDPAFDPKDSVYPLGIYTLHKIQAPAITADQLGKIDYVLLSHDHHMDNLDLTGEQLLSEATTVLTTPSGAQRLNSGGTRPGSNLGTGNLKSGSPAGGSPAGGSTAGSSPAGSSPADSNAAAISAIGLDNWATFDVPLKDGRIITITGTPCRHGPVGGDRGPVTGFMLNWKGETSAGVYITGDTVWYEGVEEVARRFEPTLILLFMGAAKLAAVGPAPLTMTVEESLRAARLFSKATIVPLHFEGWEHFSEGYGEIIRQYTAAGMLDRLHWAPAYPA